jgi:hypothetical protein
METAITASIESSGKSPALRLPVIPISLRAYSLPIVYVREFSRLVWLTFLLALGARLIQLFFGYLEFPSLISSGWALISHFVIFTPFLVSWTQLTVDGPQRIVSKRPFRYGPIEWRYLLADAVAMTALLTPIAALAALCWKIRVDQYATGGSYLALISAGIALIAALLVVLAIFVRLSFLFPAIALNRYAGISTAWRQTAGHIERLALVLGITFLPFVIPVALLSHSEAQQISGLAVVPAEVLKMVILVVMLTVHTSAMALAYKAVVNESKESSAVPAQKASA